MSAGPNPARVQPYAKNIVIHDRAHFVYSSAATHLFGGSSWRERFVCRTLPYALTIGPRFILLQKCVINTTLIQRCDTIVGYYVFLQVVMKVMVVKVVVLKVVVVKVVVVKVVVVKVVVVTVVVV